MSTFAGNVRYAQETVTRYEWLVNYFKQLGLTLATDPSFSGGEVFYIDSKNSDKIFEFETLEEVEAFRKGYIKAMSVKNRKKSREK